MRTYTSCSYDPSPTILSHDLTTTPMRFPSTTTTSPNRKLVITSPPNLSVVAIILHTRPIPRPVQRLTIQHRHLMIRRQHLTFSPPQLSPIVAPRPEHGQCHRTRSD